MKFVRRQRVGAFDIVAHLDTGGMAEVYLARYQQGPDLAVIKLLREQFKAEQDLVTMFQEEARLMTRLRHPNVVRVYTDGEADGLPYIAMEYLEGDHLGVLSKVSQRRGWPPSPSLVARIFLQVANGLAYVHDAPNERGQPLGLVHRDISPQNIFLCYDGRVKILDFGIALSADRSVATRTGMLKGKIRYMSPEQVQVHPLDRRSDLFSLGIVMWEFATGQKLFKTHSEFHTMKKICEDPVPSPREARPDLPVELEAIIMRCLERSREQRFQQATEIRQALSDFLFLGDQAGHPDELTRISEDLLGRRKKLKRSFIEAVQRQSHLQEYLFGDLGDGLESDSGVDADNPPQRPHPVLEQAFLPDPPPDPTPDHEPARDGEPGRGEPAAPPVHTSRKVPMIVLGAVILFGCLLGTLGWLISRQLAGPSSAVDPPVEDAGAALAAVEPGPRDAGAAQTAPPGPAAEDGGLAMAASADEPNTLPPPPAPVDAGPLPAEPDRDENVGYLRLRTRPLMDVFHKGEFVGKTPIREMALKPGLYLFLLQNKEEGIQKRFRVRIRKGEISSHEIMY